MSSVSSKILTTVALLNNKATKHMTLGEHTEAIVSLAQAASSLKQISKNEEGTTSRVVVGGDYNDAGNFRRLSFDFVPPQEEDNNNAEISAGFWYIYKYAIHVVFVEPQAPGSSSPSFMSMSLSRQKKVTNILAYAVHFNLALCYHLIGCDVRFDPKSSSRLLKRAAHFYNHGQDLLLKHGAEYLLLNENRGVHAFAIVNNMGHVYLRLKREIMANLCSQRLWEGVTFISSSNAAPLLGRNSNSEQEKRLRMDRESDSCIAGFVTNVSYQLFASSSPAPVA